MSFQTTEKMVLAIGGFLVVMVSFLGISVWARVYEDSKEFIHAARLSSERGKHVHIELLHAHGETSRYWNGKKKSLSVHALFEHKGEKGKHHRMSASYGIWKSWWPDGNRKTQKRYCGVEQAEFSECLPGQLHGWSRSWYANGKAQVVQAYLGGRKTGERKEWYQDGTLKSRQHFKNGKAQGLYERFWWNSRVAQRGQYESGQKQGLWRSWYLNGKLRGVENYKAGKPHGPWQEWWWICNPSGCQSKKMDAGTYKDGLKDGVWKNFQAPKVELQVWSKGQRVR